MDITATNKSFTNWLIALRRHFHQHPEVSYSEVETQKKLMLELSMLGIENYKIAGTGVIGTIKGGKKGKTIAIRADMDALKIHEKGTSLNASYISQNDGIMHACGHDGHMSIVMGAARLLQENRNHLNGNVRLIFQPAEEVPPGGAVKVIEEGGLNGVDSILGLHLFPNYNSGDICMKEGPMMASNCKFEIIITGKSGHHFNAEACIDPIAIGAEFITIIRNAISTSLPESAKYVFETGTLHGGDQFNQIPDNLSISGSYRVLDVGFLTIIEQTLKQALDQLMQKYKKENLGDFPKYELAITTGYPVLVNNPKYTKAAVNILRKHYKRVTENIKPVMASDDFAYYLQKIPGTFLFIGTRNPQKGLVNELHSNCFDIDEHVLLAGTKVLCLLVSNFLEKPSDYLQNH
ncbi:MAG: amidohydrolase [Bacteroidales bacterium]|nr:amidohydrolase [Bacteroidales bacterium]